MKNILLKLGLLTMLLFSFVACNSAEETEAPSQETKAETEAQTETESQASETEAEAESEDSEEAKEETESKGQLRIATSPNFHDSVLAAEPALEAMGYDVEVVAFNDVIQPNVALSEGQVECTIHQHEPYLNQYNEDNNTDLVYVHPLVANFMAFYSTKYDSIDELPDGAKVGTYEDISNQHRSLVFAEEIGLITLEEPSDESGMYTLLDIAENPKNLDFVTLDRGNMLNGIDELDGCFSNSEILSIAERDASQYLERETSKEYQVGLVVNPEDEDAPWINDIIEAYKDEATKKRVDEAYLGGMEVVVDQ